MSKHQCRVQSPCLRSLNVPIPKKTYTYIIYVIKFHASSSLKDQIANLESENECLRSQAAAVVEQKVHPEKIETDQEVSVVQQIQPRAIADNVTAQIKVTLF